MANILLVDASPLIYANYNAMKRFKTKSGESTGLRFGFMRSMKSYVAKTQADRVAVCLDLPGPVKKAEGNENYKANRTWSAEKEEMYGQVPALMEMLSYTRYATAQAVGYEADDVIACLARKFANADHHVYIVTPDNDLLQLVNDRVKIWMPPKKKDKAWLKDETYCYDTFGVHPQNLLHYRCIVGDTSDNLPGVKLNAESKRELAKFLNRVVLEELSKEEFLATIWPQLPRVVTTNDTLPKSPQQVYELNYEIMKLHDPSQDELDIKKGKKDPEALRKLFLELEMKSLVPHVGRYTGIQDPGLFAEDA